MASDIGARPILGELLYIDRKNENVIFTPLYLGDHLSDWNQICYTVARQPRESTFQISRHTIVCRAAQEAGAPHREYIDRKNENVIFTPLYFGDHLSDWNQICYTVARQPRAVADPGWGIWGKCPPPFKKLHTRSRYSNRAVNYSNKAVFNWFSASFFGLQLFFRKVPLLFPNSGSAPEGSLHSKFEGNRSRHFRDTSCQSFVFFSSSSFRTLAKIAITSKRVLRSP